MFRRLVFSGCVLVLVGVGVSAVGAQIHVGAGSQSCGQWLEARRRKKTGDLVRRSTIISWVQGYLVGTAEGVTGEKIAPEIADRIAQGELPPDLDGVFSDPQGRLLAILQAKFGTRSGWVFDPPDSDAIQVWLDKYCREHPLDSVSRATTVLVDSLYGRHSRK